jgi:hypothetical protein
LRVVAEITGRGRTMAAEVINFLWEGFHRQPDQVKGDILYMFGKIGDRRAQHGWKRCWPENITQK